MIKVLLADDHKLFREGMGSLLKNDQDIELVGEAENGIGLFYKYFDLKPAVMLVDIAMPRSSGPEAVKRIIAKDPEAKALFLSMHLGEEYIYHVLKAGGRGLISKNAMKEEVVHGIKTVHEGGKSFFGKSDNELYKIISKYDVIQAKENTVQSNMLSTKQIDILKLIADGMTSREIAEELEVSKRTVDTHRARMMDKLGLDNFSELMKFAINYIEREND